MLLYRNSFRKATDLDLPSDLDPEICPIIATHIYGVELPDVREVFSNLARPGDPPPAEPIVAVIEGGRP